MRRWATLALSGLALAAAVVPLGDDAASGSTNRHLADTPAHQLLVVTANLRAAFESQVRLSKLDSFGRRLLRQVPFVPDVLLLQEVKRSSARYVARLMTRLSGDRFIVGNRLHPLPWVVESDGTRIQTDAAVVVNRATMAPNAHGGFIRTPDPWPEKGHRMIKQHAYLMAREKASGARAAMASIHFPPAPGSRKTNRHLFGKWAGKVASSLGSRFPNATRVIGGDFNQVLKNFSEGGAGGVLEHHFGYRLVAPKNNPVVDFIFARSQSIHSGQDPTKGPYSDHRFVWALVRA